MRRAPTLLFLICSLFILASCKSGHLPSYTAPPNQQPSLCAPIPTENGQQAENETEILQKLYSGKIAIITNNYDSGWQDFDLAKRFQGRAAFPFLNM